MTNQITDETIEYVSVLAKLELSQEERRQAKKDMEEMLQYFDRMRELDTENIQPLFHILPNEHVFREDVGTHGDGSGEALQKAPEVRNNL
ncbi:MAG: Asp-tRNA(Asn)/Glu-tRNA(Gln) amidotransferase subunit GatC, partial [Acetatifactor sp.]|nr:Asp-tRNA(Asn)/Glu-tRNA(Gln) amidotransferase subunit GatC [Acetatifactor sp.]